MAEKFQRGVPALTRVALVVAPGEDAYAAALRYVENLGDTAFLHVYAEHPERSLLRRAAARKRITSEPAKTPEQAIRMAHMVVIFGKSPFTASECRILEQQGISVEHEPIKQKKRHGGRPSGS